MRYKGHFIVLANEGRGADLIREKDSQIVHSFSRVPEPGVIARTVNKLLAHPKVRVREKVIRNIAIEWNIADRKEIVAATREIEKKIRKLKFNTKEKDLFHHLRRQGIEV